MPNLACFFFGGGGGGGLAFGWYSAGWVPFRDTCIQQIIRIPVDGNFEDVTTAILREIGQDSDSPDSDSFWV